jgi:hypothetical protein
MTNDPAIVTPKPGKFTDAERARWPQYSGVRRKPINDFEYEDQFLLLSSLHESDARSHFAQHGFRFQGRLAFNVPFASAPSWLIKLSLGLGRLIY